MLELDGRTLEGGGQLIRIALCLSALTRIAVKITNIRGNRSGGGGLKAQHLACVSWLAHASNAHVQGAEKGSQTLLFQPGEIQAGLSPAFKKRRLEDGSEIYESKLEIGTAGSTGLALQAILPFILFTKFPSPLPVHLKLCGGTNVSGSPSFEYVQHVLLPTMAKIGFPEIKASLAERGWSQGGMSIGNFTLEIPPRGSTVSLPAFQHAPPSPKATLSIDASGATATLQAIFIAPTSTHEHLRQVLQSSLQDHFPTIVSSATKIECLPSLHEKRFYFILILRQPEYTLATDWLYDRKISPHNLDRPATEMAERVTKSLVEEFASGTWVDEHLRDQLVIFQALADGRSEVYPGREIYDAKEGGLREPSLHAQTAEWVAKKMLGRTCRFDARGCDGVGFGVEERKRGLEGRLTALKISNRGE